VKWALLFVLGGTGTLIVLACILALLVRHRLQRMHRVDPSVPTEAPMTWLVDPRAPARLHRRLTKVGRTAGTIADDHRPPSRRLRRTPPAPPIVGVAEDLRTRAVAVDRSVARATILAPAARSRSIGELVRSVDELEHAATRLVSLSAEVRTPRQLEADHPGLLDVAGRIDRLADAHADLLDIEREVGLVPERQITPPAPAVREAGGR
jgi:hypothetical protein